MSKIRILGAGLILCAVHAAGWAQQSTTQQDGQQQTPPVIPETEVVAPPRPTQPPVNPLEPTPGDFNSANPAANFPATNSSADSGRSIFQSPPAMGYRAASSTTGSIIDIPDADLPATVNSIPQALLQDQIVLTIDNLARNAGGVTPSGDIFFSDRLLLRGLEVGSRSFRKDGFFDPTYVPRDFQNVERVEILKGPASVLYGAGDPAGLVNVITKKPLAARFADLGFTFGSWDRARFTFDVNGLGDSSGTVLYRINAAQEDAESFVDFDYLSRTQISPAVTWWIDPSTSLTWSGEWHRHNTLGFQGTPAVNGDPLFLPPDAFVGEPAHDFFRTEEFRQSLVYRRQLDQDWWFSLGGYSLFYDFPSSGTAAASQVNPVPPLFIRSQNDATISEEQSHSAIANLGGDHCLGSLPHKTLLGIEYIYFDSETRFDSNLLLNPFDVTNPVYVDPPAVPLFTANFPVFRQQRVGGYLQDLTQLTPRWQALVGVRWDSVDFDFERDIGFGEVETEQSFNRASPRAGLVYQPWGDEVLSYFYSYAQSFTPPGGGIYLNGDLLPILGESHEAGVKTELIDGLYFTASGFHTTRQNDAFNVQSIVLVQLGEIRSQGAELNLLGSITEDWSIVANYTYTDARLSDPNPQFDGRRARNVPFHLANVWSRWDLYRDSFHRWGTALGFVYFGDRPADLENDLILPSFGRWDAGLYYQRGRWDTGVYLENLFDLQYAASSLNELQIFQGAPFNVRANVGVTF
jgi:iron complex outermembrane receptor protein